MLQRLRAFVSALAASAVLAVGMPRPAAAAIIGPYTLPFYELHTVTQDYGNPANVCSCEPAGHGFPHWHKGIDYSMGISTDLAASRIGTISSQKEDLYDGQGPDQFGQGNFVFVRHDTTSPTRWSLYYHLTHNGVLFANGTDVSAGEHIAESGNTGNTTGPHLHYSLNNSAGCQTNLCDVDPRQWTTDPGRIPFAATYVSESNAGTETIGQGRTITHWVKFKNTGGRSWFNVQDGFGKGRITLRATTSSGTTSLNSVFEASDWETATIVTVSDSSFVQPDQTATFTFGLFGGAASGSTTNAHFNLRADSVAWFKYTTLSSYYIPIHIE